MEILKVQALLAGLFFGIWPLLMSRSGLTGNISSLIFIFIMFLCIFPFGISDISTVVNSNYLMLIGASLFSAVGLILFNSMLTTASPKDIGSLFIMMIMVQISVPAIYDTVVNGGVTTAKVFGFLFAIVAAILLSK